jgi:type IX secretion system PorP/SprF family membrane protein
MKKLYFLLLTFSLAGAVNAQQDPQFSLWMFDKISFNPAAAGIDNMHQVQAFHRDQWDGFDRDPKTYLFNYNGYVKAAGRTVGLGLSAMTEVLGQETNRFIRLSGAYHLPIGNNILSAGVQVGILQKSFGGNWIAVDPNDPIVGDLNAGNTSDAGLDANVGLMFYQKNKYYAGVSMTHLPASSLTYLNFTSARHLYAMGGYNYDLNNGLVIRSNALVKTDLKADPAIDVNANVLWNNLLWGGVAYRLGDAIVPMAGMQMTLNTVQQGRYTYTHGFKMGYAYDVTLSAIRDYSAGSHEFFVTYEFNLGKAPIRRISGDPRLL